jgi:hypothetical protein
LTRLSEIIRLGVSAEASEVWDAVEALCECKSPSKRLELIADLERVYGACMDSYAGTVEMIEDYMEESDGETEGA